MSDQNPTLENSLAAVQGGDREAYRTVVAHSLPVVRAFVAGKSLPGMDVDDIVQRTFVEAYQSIGQYRLGSNFRAWILTIARYQVMMETTRLRRQADYLSRFLYVTVSRQMEKQMLADQDEDPRLELLKTCLEKVPTKGREVLRKRYETGMSNEEIASRLRRTVGAIRKELCMLRKKLRECVQQELDSMDHPRSQRNPDRGLT
ncbi:MAG: sigma-70 family RNA polymerase sigma factor [Planctomycetota bacterium]